MALDSPAAFNERVNELGLGAHLAKFHSIKWTTMATLAFSSPQQDEAAFKKNILEPGLGSAEHADHNLLRRLWFEAFVMSAADLKRRSEATADDGPRKMPAAERRERFLRVENRLAPGVVMRDDLEVSHRLIERCVDMFDANSLKHLALELCTKRHDEVRGIEKDPTWATIPCPQTGSLVLKQVRDDVRSPVDSQFDFIHAHMRRGMAMEMADLLAFENHEILRKKFVAALTKKPMTGFQAVGFGQIFDADVEFWMALADLTRDGIKRSGGAVRPCDAAFKEAITSDNFLQAMMPRQGSAAPARQHFEGPAAAASTQPGAKTKAQKKLKKQQQAGANIAAAFAQPKGAKQQAKGKAKGSRDAVKLPAGLMGMCARSSSQTGSKRMCFGFNLGSCSAAAAGQEEKGAHLCMRPAAGGEACSKAYAVSSNACA